MIRIGIICPSEIAFRRFLPSLRNVKEFTFAGVAIASPAEWAGAENVTDKTCASIENERIKAQPFIDIYGGKIFEGYETMIRSDEIDAVYPVSYTHLDVYKRQVQAFARERKRLWGAL